MTLDPIIIAGSMIGLTTAFIFHEWAHAQAAYALGDPTSKYDGRLTLNPIVHLDPVGSLVMLASSITFAGQLMLGWAKPVMFNRDNFKHEFLDGALVAAAGPIINIAIAFAVAVLMAVGLPLGWVGSYLIKANVCFGIFNSFPLPPLDGWKILQAFVPRSTARGLQRLEEKLGIYAPVFLLLIFPLVAPIYKMLVGSLFQVLGAN